MSEYPSSEMSNRLLYQVTLASGRIVTGPGSFGDGETVLEDYFRPVFSEDGRLLTIDADAVRRAAAEAQIP